MGVLGDEKLASAQQDLELWQSTAMTRGLEPLCCEERLGELGLGSPGKRELRADLTAAFQYSEGACQKDGDRDFIRVCCDRTRGKGFKLKEGRCSLDDYSLCCEIFA